MIWSKILRNYSGPNAALLVPPSWEMVLRPASQIWVAFEDEAGHRLLGDMVRIVGPMARVRLARPIHALRLSVDAAGSSGLAEVEVVGATEENERLDFATAPTNVGVTGLDERGAAPTQPPVLVAGVDRNGLIQYLPLALTAGLDRAVIATPPAPALMYDAGARAIATAYNMPRVPAANVNQLAFVVDGTLAGQPVPFYIGGADQLSAGVGAQLAAGTAPAGGPPTTLSAGRAGGALPLLPFMYLWTSGVAGGTGTFRVTIWGA